MTESEVIKYLLGGQLPQYRFSHASEVDEGEVVLYMERQEDAPYVCTECGQACLFYYDEQKERYVEDLPWGETRIYLHFKPRRIRCPHCGKIHVELLPGLTPKSRQTDRFRLQLARWCEDATIASVARRFGLDESTVHRIDKEFLEKREREREKTTCRRLGMDEIALKKGRCYATVFYDHDRKCVIDMVEGRKSEDIERFFAKMGPEWCASVEVVTSDLWWAYKFAVRKFLTNATIVTDKFHVFQYAGEALDELRRKEYARQQDKTDFNLKSCRFLIQKANSRLDAKGKERIEQLKAINANLYTGYLLKEQTVTFYSHKTHEEAERYLEEWIDSCISSNLKQFVFFGKRLRRHKESILAYFDHRVSNGFAEGINNKIKVIKRMAFGFHDFNYFRLKIFAATGNIPALPKRGELLAA